MISVSAASCLGVLLCVLLAASSGVNGYGSSADSEDDEPGQEFVLPYPRLGRYMDYAVLKVLAEYLKDNYNYEELLNKPATLQPSFPSAGDVILQRELRDMKGKGYGIPIPRVGKRSASDQPFGEVMPAPGTGMANPAVRTLLADLLRASFESKRGLKPIRLMQFTPRVGRADGGGGGAKTGRYSNWAPIPRVGKRR
ncbi:hypothetical protein BV898_13736 [Hypsibius exemplaris]|uniref:Uncharacterized protein n=1 Tax=Hypsibius exemplaris TaxID=2072580 RepID=A0A1W0WA31_HYPEX|nr:hypothetical protein BV898_13736 [Hypsibius exemplaris]